MHWTWLAPVGALLNSARALREESGPAGAEAQRRRRRRRRRKRRRP